MTFKEFTARVEFDDHDNVFVGRLSGTSDVVGFHADNVVSLRAAFKEAVDDYLDVCARIGKPVGKPASGKRQAASGKRQAAS